MRHMFVWLMRLLLTVLAVGTLVGFAHYSGLRDYKYNNKSSKDSNYNLNLYRVSSITSKDSRFDICKKIKIKNYKVIVSNDNDTGNNEARLIITNNHNLGAAKYYSGMFYLPVKTQGETSLMKFAVKSLAWRSGHYDGVGLMSNDQCRGYFSIKAARDNQKQG